MPSFERQSYLICACEQRQFAHAEARKHRSHDIDQPVAGEVRRRQQVHLTLVGRERRVDEVGLGERGVPEEVLAVHELERGVRREHNVGPSVVGDIGQHEVARRRPRGAGNLSIRGKAVGTKVFEDHDARLNYYSTRTTTHVKRRQSKGQKACGKEGR